VLTSKSEPRTEQTKSVEHSTDLQPKSLTTVTSSVDEEKTEDSKTTNDDETKKSTSSSKNEELKKSETSTKPSTSKNSNTTQKNIGTTKQPASSFKVIAVGDMASCKNDSAEEVSDLLDKYSYPIWGLGDFAYPDGSKADFQCFDSKVGTHKSKISPVVGNHEYYSDKAKPYFDYFGSSAGSIDKGYYSQTKGNWQILFLNSSCWKVGGCNPGNPQYEWVKQQITAKPDMCRAVVIHDPRWSSWGPYADADNLDALTRLIYNGKTDLYISGHAHHYERLAKLNPDRKEDNKGFRQFTVGTGGIALRQPDSSDVLSVSRKLITNSHGILELSLNQDSYSWKFIDINNKVLDSGSDTCN